ncbi:MAG: enoyl-CoA hydratase/isomerase family protein [Actinobacteria bacterium]|nr:enoyl-CoA hydratase/isomerase family protein [Actinomycetota bacterium]
MVHHQEAEAVHYEEADDCAVITLDRPRARNALTPAMSAAIEGHLDRAEADERVRAVILTGAPPVFCAGTDLKLVGNGEHEGVWTERGGYGGIAGRARTKPLIAALDGSSYGGGTEIVLACDLVVAARGIGLALSEAKRGLVPAGGGLFRLARRLPTNVAMRAALTGDPIAAETAHEHGLVNVLCDPGEALAGARALVAEIATCSPLAVRESRMVVLDGAGADEEEAWRLNDLAVARTVDTDDAREGVAAFFERRAPVWSGR